MVRMPSQLPVIMPPVASILSTFTGKNFSSAEKHFPKRASFCCLQSWVQSKGGERVCFSSGIALYSMSHDKILDSDIECSLQK